MRTVTINLVVELKVVEGVLSGRQPGDGYPSTSTPSRYRTISAESPSWFSKPGDRNIANLHVSVGCHIAGSRQ